MRSARPLMSLALVLGITPAAVGAQQPVTVRAAPTIDLGDVTLLPGLIDMHTHLTMDIEGNWVTRDVTEGPADAALRGARNARRTLLAVPGDPLQDVSVLQRVVFVMKGGSGREAGAVSAAPR